MSIDVGTRLGSLEIATLLGKGGMGEVYRARDTKLGRDVAIKTLPEEFISDPDRLARFQREAKLLASLNHPNIGAIYGLEEFNGSPVLILELVEGETLAERLKRGPLPIDESLKIAIDVAAALEEAHEKGVIHRDLKPGNIKLTPEGKVKVLDFGLAKALEGNEAPAVLSNSPTLTNAATLQGVILGTAAYMAPEQARGRVVDKRADIWSFGVVLFEMLAGRRLFQGEDVSETLASVIKEEPQWELVPVNVRRLLRSCLERDPKRRLRDIGDAWGLLDETPPANSVPARPWIAWAAAALFAILSAIAFWAPWRTPSSTPESMRFQIPLPEKTSASLFSVSPDGRWLAFLGFGSDGVRRLWVREMNSLEARPFRGTEGAGSPPFWSPDSRFIAFYALGRLKKIDLSGDPPQTICDLNSVLGGSWSRDDVIIVGTGGPLMRVSAAGGIPTPITVLDASRKENRHLLPVFLPDGKHFLYLRYSSAPENSGIYVGSLDSKPAEQSTKQLVATIFGPGYVSSRDSSQGHLLFLRDQVLMKQPFDVSRLELSGEPKAIAEPVGSAINAGFFAASLDNVLVYRTGGFSASATSVLTWYDRQGRQLGTASEPASYANLALSPDGMRAAVSQLDTKSAVRDIWIIDFVRNTPTRFTFGSGLRTESPVWSPDGSRIVFRSDRDGVYNLYQKPTSGAKDEELLLKSDGNKTPTSWSHDGRFLLYTDFDVPKRKSDLWLLPLNGNRKPAALFATQFSEADGQFSPDGQFVAYLSDESGRFEVYVAEISGTSTAGKWQASQNGGDNPRWRGDGKALFYSAPDGTVMETEVSAAPTFQAGTPKPLFKLPPGSNGFDMTSDGNRFLVSVPVEQDAKTPFTVILNWQTDFKK